MIKLLSKHPDSVIGLDIGESAIKAVQVTKKNNLVSLDGYSSALNNSINLNSSIALRSTLKDLLQNPKYGKLDAKNVVINLPRQNHKATLLSVPLAKHKYTKPEKLVQNHLKLIHNNIDEMFYDYQRINNSSTQDSAILNTYSVTSVPIETTHSIKNSLLHYGVKNIRYSSILNTAARRHTPSGIALNLLDIGHQTSRYVFIHEHVIILDDFDFGANQLVNRLARDINIKQAQAIELLKKSGLYGGEFANKARHSFEESINTFLNEFQLILQKYNQSFVENKLEDTKVTICGAIAGIPGFTEFMSTKLRCDTQIIKPWQNTDIYPLKPMSPSKSSLFSTAIGLALSLD